MKFRLKQLNQSGDTLVEVLIAVAVITSVLAGAFLVAQKSSQAVRSSQEHSEMLQLLQGQVELVRSLALTETTDTTGVFSTSPKYFCMNATSGSPQYGQRVPLPNLGGSLPPLAIDDFTKYGAPGPCAAVQNLYNFAATYDPSSKVFTFTGRWDRLGAGKNQEQLSYRIYPGAYVYAPPPPPPAPAALVASPSPASPGGTPSATATCEQLLASSLTDPSIRYYNVLDYNGFDWHVGYATGTGPHVISDTDLNLSPPMAAGNYHVWTIASDSSYNYTGTDLRLHYVGYGTGGGVVFKTGDTPNMPKVKNPGDPPNPEGIWNGNITIAQPVFTLKAEHRLHAPGEPTPPDDSTDSDCFAYQKF